jgi:hypothetical protein
LLKREKTMNARNMILAAATAASMAASAVASPGPDFTAVVDSDGTLARGLNATGATHLQTGVYEVAFSKDVSGCGYTATIGLSGSVGSSGFGTVNVAKRSGKKKAIFVQTFDTSGDPADLGFHVIVAC